MGRERERRRLMRVGRGKSGVEVEVHWLNGRNRRQVFECNRGLVTRRATWRIGEAVKC